MKYATPIIAAALSLAAAPVLAGSPAPAEPQPVIQPVPVVPAGVDWTGPWAGLQLGYGQSDTNIAGVDGDGMIGGLIAGYDYDFGNWVLGAGLDYDWTDMNLGAAADIDNIFRAKLRGGYELGNGLLYATGGYAHADTNTLGSDDGYFIGAGYEHMVSQNFSVGGEVLWHRFDDFNGTTADIEATTLQLRGAFRF